MTGEFQLEIVFGGAEIDQGEAVERIAVGDLHAEGHLVEGDAAGFVHDSDHGVDGQAEELARLDVPPDDAHGHEGAGVDGRDAPAVVGARHDRRGRGDSGPTLRVSVC